MFGAVAVAGWVGMGVVELVAMGRIAAVVVAVAGDG